MMKKLIAKLTNPPLSEKALNTPLKDFAGRLAGVAVGAPLGGFLMGLLADYLWPGEISWTLALTLLGLASGCGYLWYWIRRT